MASTVYTVALKDKTGDDAYPTVLSSGTAVTAMTVTENGGVLTITCTT
jgi:hypothetical protein